MELIGFIVLVLGSLFIIGFGLAITFVTASFASSDQDYIGVVIMFVGAVCLYLTCQHAPFHMVWSR